MILIYFYTEIFEWTASMIHSLGEQSSDDVNVE